MKAVCFREAAVNEKCVRCVSCFGITCLQANSCSLVYLRRLKGIWVRKVFFLNEEIRGQWPPCALAHWIQMSVVVALISFTAWLLLSPPPRGASCRNFQIKHTKVDIFGQEPELTSLFIFVSSFLNLTRQFYSFTCYFIFIFIKTILFRSTCAKCQSIKCWVASKIAHQLHILKNGNFTVVWTAYIWMLLQCRFGPFVHLWRTDFGGIACYALKLPQTSKKRPASENNHPTGETIQNSRFNCSLLCLRVCLYSTFIIWKWK